MNRRRLLVFVAVVVAAAAVYQFAPRQQAKQAPLPVIGPNGDLLNPSKLVTLRCVLAGGGPCTVSVAAHSGDTRDRLIFKLKPGEPGSQSVLGPLTVDSVIVDRAGKVNRQELKLDVPAGETREFRVQADDTVEVVTP
jgi:hypothetical protein